MGECCSNEYYPEERKIFDSFEKIDIDNINDFNIINYDEITGKIFDLHRNSFYKIAQFQLLRVNFIKELKKEITNDNKDHNNYYQQYLGRNNLYINNNYFSKRHNNKLSENQKTLYYIIIMTLILKYYLKRNFISNELEITLLELSVVIMNKKYNNKDMKLILFYLSKMFEILFKRVHNIQNFINFKEYLTKINIITTDNNLLTKEEKYLFIKTHIISIGEWFHQDLKATLIENYFRLLLLKYYSYLFVQNYDFIVQNYYEYEKDILVKNNYEHINKIRDDDYYNENDLIPNDIGVNNTNIIKNEDLNKISNSIHYFFIICTEDIFTGKNIFLEFHNILNNEILLNNLNNNINLIKFKKSIFHILFKNLLTIDYSTTMLFSFLDYIIEYGKLGVDNTDTYYKIIINLYGRFYNNRMFLDKYSSFISEIFINEIENNKKEKIINELYKYIIDLNIKNNKYKYTNFDNGNMKITKHENIYFFINIFKNISLYYKKQNNIIIINDILIYLNNLAIIIRRDYQKKSININKYNNKYLYDNINITLKNFYNYQNDFLFNLNEKVQLNLSKFISSYILMINDLCEIDYKDMMGDFDYSIIYSITIMEIKIIKYNKINSMNKIQSLLNLLIKHLNSQELNENEKIFNSLNNNLKLIKYLTYTSNAAYITIQFTTFQLKLIYVIIIIILFHINKNNSDNEVYIIKHKKILLKINQYNQTIGSCFHNLSDIKNIYTNNISNLLQGQIYAITHVSFFQIIYFIQKELFSEENQNDQINFRSRTLYQNDKNSEMNIYIDTKNNLPYNNKSYLLRNNHLIKDTWSKYSNDTFSHRKVNSHYFQNYKVDDIFSEKINMPIQNSYNYNERININNMTKNNDIISEKSSIRNFELKI